LATSGLKQHKWTSLRFPRDKALGADEQKFEQQADKQIADAADAIAVHYGRFGARMNRFRSLSRWIDSPAALRPWRR
jgi:hypothetical protein